MNWVNNRPWNFAKLINMASEIGDNEVLSDIESFQAYLKTEQIDNAMNWAFAAPENFALIENVFFLVMIVFMRLKFQMKVLM